MVKYHQFFKARELRYSFIENRTLALAPNMAMVSQVVEVSVAVAKYYVTRVRDGDSASWLKYIHYAS